MNQQKDETDQQAKLRQFRQMERETTDPLARRLIRDIVSDLEAQSLPNPDAPSGKVS